MKKTLSVALASLLLIGILSMLSFSAFAAEDAPDTLKDSKLVNVNTGISDNIASSSDIDYFMFTLSSPGKVSLTMNRTYQANSNEYWAATLYGYDTNEICFFSFSGVETVTTTYIVGLNAGTYYLRVTGGNFYSGYSHNHQFSSDTYSMCINYSASNNVEKENNNSIETATSISVNQAYEGSINDSYDVDYYSFTLSSAGLIHLSLSRPTLENSDEYQAITLYKYDTTEICAYSFNGIDTTTDTYRVGLDKGIYYIKVTGGNFYSGYSHNNQFTTNTYSLTVNYSATENAERESNESVASATKLAVNQNYTGSINDSYDVDYYSFTLSSAGLMNISLSRPQLENASEFYVITLLGLDTKEICAYSFNGTDSATNTYSIGLDSGTYYLRVTGGNFYSGYSHNNQFTTSTYSLCVKFSATAYAEKENNEDATNATAITVNQDYKGSINDSYDVDYYKFSLPAAGKISFSLSRPVQSSTNEIYAFTLFGSDLSEICKYSFHGLDATTSTYTIGLDAGTYYVKITGGNFYSNYSHNNQFITDTYTLRIQYVNTDYCEKENNETASTATQILLNKDYEGSINDGYDVDYYKLVIPAAKNYNIYFQHERINSSSEYWNIVLLSEGLNEVGKYSIIGTNASSATPLLKLSAGTYYLKITGGNFSYNYSHNNQYSKDLYTFSIKENAALAFTDVPTGAYYYDAVRWAVENNVTSGTSATTFSPNADCTRAQVVTFLWRAAGSPNPKSSYNPFSDVKSGAYYYKAVLWAVENKITAGTSATTFSPDASCTRSQVVTFLWRYEGNPSPNSSANPFKDVKSGSYYYTAVLWAVGKKVTSGTSSNTFSPDDTCTRAQVVTFLYRDIA